METRYAFLDKIKNIVFYVNLEKPDINLYIFMKRMESIVHIKISPNKIQKFHLYHLKINIFCNHSNIWVIFTTNQFHNQPINEINNGMLFHNVLDFDTMYIWIDFTVNYNCLKIIKSWSRITKDICLDIILYIPFININTHSWDIIYDQKLIH